MLADMVATVKIQNAPPLQDHITATDLEAVDVIGGATVWLRFVLLWYVTTPFMALPLGPK